MQMLVVMLANRNNSKTHYLSDMLVAVGHGGSQLETQGRKKYEYLSSTHEQGTPTPADLKTWIFSLILILLR
jgi:hypothetical protein